jgi:hypothetical protein
MKLTSRFGCEVKRFAIFPVRLDSGVWVWLEWYFLTRHEGAFGNWRERWQD